MGYPPGLTPGAVPIYPGMYGLPEEVQAALDERQMDVRSEDEMQQLINDLMLRR